MQVKGKSLNNPPPPPQALSLPLKRILSPSDICPKQFWDFFLKFPENFRNIFEHFPLLCLPTIYKVSRPSEVFFRYFFEHFSLFSERFSEHFEHFSVTFRAFSVTPSAPFPLHVRTIALQFLELCCRATTCRLSARKTPIKSEDTSLDTFNINVERTHI